LGLITSPILADQILRRVDQRIAAACKSAGLTYTRFVDDLTVSGDFDLSSSGIPGIINDVLQKDGFRSNDRKQEFGQFDGKIVIAGVRPVRGRMDVGREYLLELLRQMDDAQQLAHGRNSLGPTTRDSRSWVACGLWAG
jgi:hypothetical protein